MTRKEENSVGIVETKTIRVVEQDKPMELGCGKTLAPIDVAYETYGEINTAGDNAILICHALSGNAHVAGKNKPDDEKVGWWDVMIGPGKGIDTDKYFVICSNILGGCSGTTGPASINPVTKKPYGLDFPMITVGDMVKTQKRLLDKLNIKQLLAVVGGSIGGMQVIQWTIDYPDFVKSAIAIATTARLGAQSIAFDAVGRNAILADPNFNDGQYHNENDPAAGLSIARMIGHITYLSEEGMREKFGRQLRNSDSYSYEFDSEFAVETYLDYQGRRFVERFDANSYLYITKAADYFDPAKEYGSLKKAFEKIKSRFLVVSFSSDWLFTPHQSRDIVQALAENGKDVSHCDIDSPYGHDAFLLEPQILGGFLGCFLHATSNKDQSNSPEPCCRQNTQQIDKTVQTSRTRVDYELIESLIEPNSTVLDVGCGSGQLLARLIDDKNIKGEGVELQQEFVLDCVCRKLPIIQQDIENGFGYYTDNRFDYVVLSQTVQTVKNPEKVFAELLRIGKKVIVSFPNFANWRCRMQLFFNGCAPVTRQLPFGWYDTLNIHCLSIKDFDRFCEKLNVTVERKIPLIKTSPNPVRFVPNLFAEQAIYVISK